MNKLFKLIILFFILYFIFNKKEKFTNNNLCSNKNNVINSYSINLFDQIKNDYIFSNEVKSKILSYFKDNLIKNFTDQICTNNNNIISEEDFKKILEDSILKQTDIIENNLKILGAMKKKNIKKNVKLQFHLFYWKNCKYSKQLLCGNKKCSLNNNEPQKKEKKIKKILNKKKIQYFKYEKNDPKTKDYMDLIKNELELSETGYPFVVITDSNENIIDSFAGNRSIKYIKNKINSLY